jgi:hypothetical protein
MKNPPDFVMYVVMVKAPGNKTFNPHWTPTAFPYTRGFQRKADARFALKSIQVAYGKTNAYVQQYGPIS